MRDKNNRMNKTGISIVAILVFIFMNFSVCAAGFMGIGNTASWKEEVLLHDGSKIIVERWQKRGGNREPGQQPGISDQSITFTIPGTNKTIKWEDAASDELGGRANFILAALHIMNNIPYIIAKPRLCQSYNKWGRPNPPYIIFKYESKEWKRIELAKLPVEFKNINLVITTGGDEEELVSQSLASSEMVKELNSELKQEEYKTIIRTPIKIGCEEMVHCTNGKWYGIDWFSDQPSYQACLNFCKSERIAAENCPCSRYYKNNTKGR
jgi:hypothetical protein